MKKIVHWSVRALLLLLAVMLLMAGPVPEWILRVFDSSGGFIKDMTLIPVWMAKCVPAASPLSLLASSVADRGFRFGFLWLAPALLLAGMAVFKGRLFCRWVCPLGTLYAAASVKHQGKHFLKHRLSGYVFWGVVASSLCGYPLLLFLDPLATFSRINMPLEGAATVASLIPGLIVPVLLIASVFQPVVWCARICPLGYMFDLLYRSDTPYSRKFSHDRRELLVGMLCAAPAAFLLRRNFFRSGESFPLLPPGAGDKARYASLCTRCYACVNVCPTRILTVGFPDSSDPSRWFLPEMNPAKGTCQETCDNCVKVCPTGAIRRLTYDEKRNTQLGVAEVCKDKCIAWHDGEYCMVCSEYCPYVAIKGDDSGEGVPRPVVDPEKCRGCGICQNNCPVRDGGPAIIVRGNKRQRILASSAGSTLKSQ